MDIYNILYYMYIYYSLYGFISTNIFVYKLSSSIEIQHLELWNCGSIKLIIIIIMHNIVFQIIYITIFKTFNIKKYFYCSDTYRYC